MAKYMLVAGKHYDQESKQTYRVQRGSQPVAVDSSDPLDKLFPNKFVKAAAVERGREVQAKAVEEAAKSKEVGLIEGQTFPNAETILQEAKVGEEVRRGEKVEAGEDPDAAEGEDARPRGRTAKVRQSKATRTRKSK